MATTHATTWVFDWRDMRANVRAAALLFALILGTHTLCHAADRDDPAPAREEETDKPEFTPRPLPADTFKPSEEVSEDFPVPFPVDI